MDVNEVCEKVLQAISATLDSAPDAVAPDVVREVLGLAEAWAWLMSPAQPHGGQTPSP
jgi:hypothetical protein